jgi:uncharacterized protein (UPF0335 family)
MSEEQDRYRVTAGELRGIVERIERLLAERADIAEVIKDHYAEARSRGYDVKVLRKLIALRKRDSAEVSEEAAILKLYAEALGMVGPSLFDWSAEREAPGGDDPLVEEISKIVDANDRMVAKVRSAARRTRAA